jgi:peptidoglycan hydrolase-like protein with peptidoglycan-binding domain
MRVSKSEVHGLPQKLDKKRYYSGREDGIIGPETTAARRDFQKKNGLRVAGAPANRASIGGEHGGSE